MVDSVKHFPFLALPRELRDLIYHGCLVPGTLNIHEDHFLPYKHYRLHKVQRQQVNTSLLRVNRQVCEEASEMLHTANVFTFGGVCSGRCLETGRLAELHQPCLAEAFGAPREFLCNHPRQPTERIKTLEIPLHKVDVPYVEWVRLSRMTSLETLRLNIYDWPMIFVGGPEERSSRAGKYLEASRPLDPLLSLRSLRIVIENTSMGVLRQNIFCRDRRVEYMIKLAGTLGARLLGKDRRSQPQPQLLVGRKAIHKFGSDQTLTSYSQSTPHKIVCAESADETVLALPEWKPFPRVILENASFLTARNVRYVLNGVDAGEVAISEADFVARYKSLGFPDPEGRDGPWQSWEVDDLSDLQDTWINVHEQDGER